MQPLDFYYLRHFDRAWAKLKLPEEQLQQLELQLMANPLCGDVIQGLEGVRKLRIRLPGQGKRGGGRVIYFFYAVHTSVVFLDVFGKSDKTDLSNADKRRVLARLPILREMIETKHRG